MLPPESTWCRQSCWWAKLHQTHEILCQFTCLVYFCLTSLYLWSFKFPFEWILTPIFIVTDIKSIQPIIMPFFALLLRLSSCTCSKSTSLLFVAVSAATVLIVFISDCVTSFTVHLKRISNLNWGYWSHHNVPFHHITVSLFGLFHKDHLCTAALKYNKGFP